MTTDQPSPTTLWPATDFDRHAWLRCLEADDDATLWQHPDVLKCSRREGEPDPLLFHHAGNGSPETTCDVLGVLAGKVLAMPAPLGLQRRLQGHRLVGDQLVGLNSQAAVDRFADESANLIVSRQTDFVLLEELDVESTLRTALIAAAARRRLLTFAPAAAQPHWRIRFPDEPSDYWQKFSSKSRSEFRRRARRFEHTFVRVTQPEEVPDFLASCRTIGERSWKADQLGPRIEADARERALFSQIAAEDGFRGYLLIHQDVPVAFNIVVKNRAGLIWQETCFDDRFAGDSPGQILFFLMLQDLIEHDRPHVLDLGFGDGRHKRMFGNHSTVTGPLVICRKDVATLLTVRYRELQRWIGRRGRDLLQRTGLHTAVRQRLRRAAAGRSQSPSLGRRESLG